MFARLPRPLRRSAAQAAILCYLLPLGLPMLSEVGHRAQHLAAAAEAQRRQAVALGLLHGPVATHGPGRLDAPPAIEGGGLPDRAPAPTEGLPGRAVTAGPDSAYVHAHGGTAHSHHPVVGLLMLAADRTAGQIGAVDAAGSGLAPHVPQPRLATSVLPPRAEPRPGDHAALRSAPARSPTLPPPRV